MALPAESAFSFERFLAAVADSPADWPALRARFQDDDTFAMFARLCSWHAVLFAQLGVPSHEVSCVHSRSTSESDGAMPFEETHTTARYEASGAHYKVTLTRMYNGHMGYFEDSLGGSLVYAEVRMSLSCDVFAGGPIHLLSDGLTAERHATVVEALARTLASGA